MAATETTAMQAVEKMYDCFNRGDLDTIKSEVFAHGHQVDASGPASARRREERRRRGARVLPPAEPLRRPGRPDPHRPVDRRHRRRGAPRPRDDRGRRRDRTSSTRSTARTTRSSTARSPSCRSTWATSTAPTTSSGPRRGSSRSRIASPSSRADPTQTARSRERNTHGDTRGSDEPDGARRQDVRVLRHRRHGDDQERGLRAGHPVDAAGAQPALGREARRRRGARVLRRPDGGRRATSTTSRSGRSATTASSRRTAATATVEGQDYLFPTCSVYTIRDGRIASVQVYTADQHGVDDFFWKASALKAIPDRLA